MIFGSMCAVVRISAIAVSKVLAVEVDAMVVSIRECFYVMTLQGQTLESSASVQGSSRDTKSIRLRSVKDQGSGCKGEDQGFVQRLSGASVWDRVERGT